jgi:serine protease Do
MIAIVAQKEEKKSPACGWIGVQVRPMTAPYAASLGMAVPHGAIFDQPEAASPAAKAGIETGDVVTAINGLPLMRSSDFARILAANAPGTSVYLGTWRNGMFIRIRLTLGSSKCGDERPEARTQGVTRLSFMDRNR